MNLKVGIVGLPNAGKSTLFNALLKRQVAEAANYPFTTIEPNVGVVPVPDERLAKLATIVEQAEHVKPPMVPATVQFVDIAGLVKGASEGEGLGNKFLSYIREVDMIVNVLRYFEDAGVVHVAGDVNPQRDRDIIETELILADLQTLENQKSKSETVQKFTDTLNRAMPAREVAITDEQKVEIRDLHLLTMKPVLYVGNVSENQLSNSQIIQLSNYPILLISAKIEAELASLSEEEQKAYLKELGLEASGLDRLIRKAYEMLGLISFLTCGIKEVRAWTIEKDTKAPQAAGVIHTDFEKKFIKADVVSYEDFEGWKKAREEGKVRSEGREYEMQDGDVIEFKVGS
ncbi:redox-regulated ATPase YchF [Candidatus Gottesmanbacteria bacterium]|nr:redox-regulated ATPase YchF [Candidatus Gottesmanbacteria bacterium]